MVKVQLFGYLIKYSPTGEKTFKLELGPGATIDSLLEKIKFPKDVERAILINGRPLLHDVNLVDGDEVFIFSPAVGG